MGSRRGTLANITNLIGTPGRQPARMGKDPSLGGDDGGLIKPPQPRPSVSNPRASLAPRASIQTPRASLLPGRPSLNQSIRGGTGRSMNTSTMGGGAPRKDPRDWRDKGFVVTCQKRMLKYLSEWGFPYGIGPKTLSSPSNKEFIQMFQFLYLRIDPSYKFGSKPEDEVLPILASLQYPFKIAKSSLITPGTPHVWPSLMGAMLWMAELLEFGEAVGRCQDDDIGCGSPEDEEEERDRWISKYLLSAYNAWLMGKDADYDRILGDLYSFYESRRQMVASSVENLTHSIETMTAEIEQIQSQPPRLKVLNSKRADLVEDINKLKKFAITVQEQRDAIAAVTAEIHKTIEAEAREIEQRIKENQELQAIIDAQEITPADVERMMSTKKTLEESLQSLTEKRESVQKNEWSREVEVQKASDSLDRAISLFNNTATKLSLVGASTKYPRDVIGDQFKCITFTPHAPTADRMLNCSTKQDIKPALLKLKDYLLEKAKSLHDKFMDTHMQLEAVLEAVEEKREAVNALETKLQQHLHDYRSGKHVVAEAVKRGQAEVENIRQEAKKNSADVATMRAQSEKAVEGAGAAAEEHERNCIRERETMVQFITETLGALMEHKSNISDTLAALNQKLDEELAAAENL